MTFSCQEAANATPLHHLLRCDVLFKRKTRPIPCAFTSSKPVSEFGHHCQEIKIKTNHCPQLLPIRDYHQTYRQRNISGHSNHFASTLQPGLILGSSIHQGPDAGSLKLTSLYLHQPPGPSPGPPTDGSHQQLRGPCGSWHCKASVI